MWLLAIVIWGVGFILTGKRLWKEDLEKTGIPYHDAEEKLSDEFLNPLAVFVALRAAIWFFYWPYRFFLLPQKSATRQ